MKIDIDIPDEGDDLLPAGKHRARIFEVEVRTASTGSEYLRIGFEVTDGMHQGRKAWDTFSLVPRALWRLKRLLKSAGLPHKGPVSIETGDLEGAEVEIHVVRETYNGEERTAVKDTRPLPSSAIRSSSLGSLASPASTGAAPSPTDEVPF